MNDADTTLPMATPPLSSTPGSRPHETQIKQGAFEPPVVPGTLGKLERFDILRLLGEGGMGQVYLAREPLTDTLVAIKIMRPELAGDPQSVHRFLIEARHMYRLSHPRILRVLEVSDRKGGPYYVMPYIEGGSLLGQYRPDSLLPLERVVVVARQVAEALAHAHSHGIIHRDLKPGNVLLDREGNAYLTDFGLVRTVFNDSMVDAAASHLEGTAPYMSPAVAHGEAEDTRCDIYAFGALLYELLAGHPPYTGRTPQLILDQVLKGPPPSIRSVNPKASPALIKVAEGCMARELRDRYATMSDVVADLNRAANGKMPLGPHGRQRSLLGMVAGFGSAFVVVSLATVAIHQWANKKDHFLPQKGPVSVRAVENLPKQNQPDIVDFDADKGMVPNSHAPSPMAAVEGSFVYTVTNGAATIVKYTGTNETAAIPDKIGGFPVEHIGVEAFRQNKDIIAVFLPETVSNIDDWAFADCSRLAQIALPKHLARVGYGSFWCCPELANVTLPSATMRIGCNTFVGCRKLESIDVDPCGSIYSNSEGVLFDSAKRSLVCFPNGKKGRYLIPEGVTNIQPSAFEKCSNLTEVVFNSGLISIDAYAFMDCSKLETVCVPESVRSIGFKAFKDCDNLRALYFKGDAPVVGNKVFLNNRWTIVYYRPGTKGWGPTLGGRPTAVWQDAPPPASQPSAISLQTSASQCPFSYTANKGAITIEKYIGPGGVVAIPNMITGLPVTTIKEGAFGNNQDIIKVIIPASITSIGAFPFSLCTKLQAILVDSANPAYTSEDGVLFNNNKTVLVGFPCGKTDNYVIPDSVTKIESGAFVGCLLTHVTIPASTTEIMGATIGENQFERCPSLLSIRVDPGNPVFSSNTDGLLFNKDMTCLISFPGGKTGDYLIPKGVTCIGNHSFRGCSLSCVSIPDSVTNIGFGAFANSTDLTDVTIPSSVTFIGSNPFRACDAISMIKVDATNPAYCCVDGVLLSKDQKNLHCYPGGKKGRYVIPASVSNIVEWAFTSCLNLTAITIPQNVTRLNTMVFADCRNLTHVSIEGNVTLIELGAFRNCTKLTGLYFNGNAPSLIGDPLRNTPNTRVYYRPGTTGWGPTFGGRPTKEWRP